MCLIYTYTHRLYIYIYIYYGLWKTKHKSWKIGDRVTGVTFEGRLHHDRVRSRDGRVHKSNTYTLVTGVKKKGERKNTWS